MEWKYKQAYELLADFVFGLGQGNVITKEDIDEVSMELDEIFGEARNC